MNHCEGHNSVIRSAIRVDELLMERLFDKISNKSGPPSISCRQGLQIIKTFCRCFYRQLRRRHGPNIHPWDPGPSWTRPMEVENIQKKLLDVLPLVHHLRRSARASKPCWRPNPCQVRVCFRLQEQPAPRRTPRSHTELDLGALGMDGKIISIRF